MFFLLTAMKTSECLSMLSDLRGEKRINYCLRNETSFECRKCIQGVFLLNTFWSADIWKILSESGSIFPLDEYETCAAIRLCRK